MISTLGNERGGYIMVSKQDAARTLVEALREAIDVSEAQSHRVEEARREGEKTRERFARVMEAYQQGDRSAMRAEITGSAPSLAASQKDIQETKRLGIRWQTAFLDASAALMHLYAYPEAREQADRIASHIRAIKILEVAETDTKLPDAMMPDASTLSDANDPPESDSERRHHRATRALTFMDGMDEYHDKVQAELQAKANQTDALLRQAFEEAQALLSSD
jgi:hypothetical protein